MAFLVPTIVSILLASNHLGPLITVLAEKEDDYGSPWPDGSDVQLTPKQYYKNERNTRNNG